ncbi:MAG: MazG family protein [Frankiaceae bacterium]
MSDRLLLLATTHRVAPGLLSWPAWQALHAGPVLTAEPDHPQLPALRDVGITVDVVPGTPTEVAAAFRARAAGGSAVWLAGEGGDEAIVRAIGDLAARDGDAEVELIYGSTDLPGARLLDVVSVMDRLRSPGGCPWDAEQTHLTLAPYLLEESYEAYAAIEEGDPEGLREELGDVLLQVAFHARLAEELPADERWSLDDVAAGLVAKLIRRHPHVFATVEAPTAAHVAENWEQIKAVEKGRSSVTEGVPFGQPALALAAKLQRRAERVGIPAAFADSEIAAADTPGQAVAAAAALVAETENPVDAVGELLFAAVALAQAHNVDPEAALRGASLRFRDRVIALETDRSAL